MSGDPSPTRSSRLFAAALRGAFLGLLLGALYLGYQAQANWRYRCGEQLGNDCELAIAAMHELARLQALAAVALLLASAGLFLWARARR